MTDLNRGIMKFEGADSPKAILISSLLVLGGIAVLLWWGFHSAYTIH
ncbi:MAG TPA: hypothetical protein V6D28_22625 [Leptolyngbyaceae cyanobacterium]